MSIELGQKTFNLDELYNVAVNNYTVQVSRVLSNELSNSTPKKIKATPTQLIAMKYPSSLRKDEYLRAYFLLTLSHLARMKKAGRKNTVELLTVLLNTRIG